MSKPDDGETAIEENVTTYKSAQNEARNKVEEKNQGINLTKNFKLEEDFQFFSKTLDSQILGEGSYQTPIENLSNSKILRGRSYQTPPDNLSNSKILREGNFQTPTENLSKSQIHGEESIQTSPENLHNPTIEFQKKVPVLPW